MNLPAAWIQLIQQRRGLTGVRTDGHQQVHLPFPAVVRAEVAPRHNDSRLSQMLCKPDGKDGREGQSPLPLQLVVYTGRHEPTHMFNLVRTHNILNHF